MRPKALLLFVLVASWSCGRTDPLRYHSDASIEPGDDGGVDAGHVGCHNGVIELVPAVVKVIFVLDRSGSMSNPFGFNTRWTSLTNALANVLPSVDQSMELGALVFPSGQSDSCVVSTNPIITPAEGRVKAIVAMMRGTLPSGSTPTASALQNAGDFLLAAHAATSARALVLATDGSPNCNANLDPRSCVCLEPGPLGRCVSGISCLDDVRTVDAIRGLAQQNLPTYVIGIQDTSNTAIAVLNQMAQAGGRPQAGAQSYYAVTSQQSLETALTTIRDQIGSCVYLTSSVPTDDGSLELHVGNTIARYDPTGVDGWFWSNKDNGELVIRGAACNLVVADPTLVVEAQVECSPPDAGVDAGIRRDGG